MNVPTRARLVAQLVRDLDAPALRAVERVLRREEIQRRARELPKGEPRRRKHG